MYGPTTDSEEAGLDRFYKDLQHLLALTPKTDVLFIIGDSNAKVGSQEILEVTDKFDFGVQNEAEQRLRRILPREHTSHSKHPLPTTQEKICRQRWRSSIQSAKTRPGADCGSDHELLVAKFRLKLKKLEKTTRPFRYDLNQIPYDYTVEVRNRFKGLDLIDRVPDEPRTEVHDIVQETGIKTIPKKKKKSIRT